MGVSLRDLTTFGRVSDAILKSDAEDALTSQVFDNSGAYSDEGERGIAFASRKIKSFLNRELVVVEKQALCYSEDWEEKKRTPDNNYIYKLKYSRIREWPVLAVDEDTKVYGDRNIFAKDDEFESITYFGGYRRETQSYTDFSSAVTNEFSSDDDIPVIPEDIEDVAINLAIHFAMLRISGLVGKSISKQDIGQFTTTVRRESARENYESRQLNRIQDYRYFS